MVFRVLDLRGHFTSRGPWVVMHEVGVSWAFNNTETDVLVPNEVGTI